LAAGDRMAQTRSKMEIPANRFLRARDFLLSERTNYEVAYRGFEWPRLERFNWALDYFDVLAAGNRQTALWILEEDGSEQRLSFAELRDRSNSLANGFRRSGVRRGDRILVMLGNEVRLWETLLAAFKLGAVVIPSTTLLGAADIADRLERGEVRWVVAGEENADKFGDVPLLKCAPGDRTEFTPDAPTAAGDPMLLYFTSGTTAKPKLVEHSHQSYPVGHLSTMYWIGLQAGDVHWNIGSPGWAKHAWSCVFAPWNAGATVFVYNYARFRAADILRVLREKSVTSLCAPPTVWRMLVQEELGKVGLREALSAGEPLNPEVMAKVEAAWGVTVRDGYGQTETTAMVGNSPGQPVQHGAAGRALPGYVLECAEDGELCVVGRPLGLTPGFMGDLYHTGDVMTRDAAGYFTFVGRADDVFKASDYRISPFELESLLLQHVAVAEAAVIPAPDAVRGCVPKAHIVLAAGWQPTAETARGIFDYLRSNCAGYKRIRRIEFGELPKTVSGKIRRAELRTRTAGVEFEG
jgi:acetyl-CoA synthetase